MRSLISLNVSGVNNDVELLIFGVGYFEKPMQEKVGHVAEYPDVQQEEVDSVDDEVVKSDITNPCALVLS